jgi:hypothetical protein
VRRDQPECRLHIREEVLEMRATPRRERGELVAPGRELETGRLDLGLVRPECRWRERAGGAHEQLGPPE